MRYASAEAFRAALEERLRQTSSAASGTHQELSRRRRTVAFDRLLARLAVAPHGGWVLKGGAALEFRLEGLARATRDIDLALTLPLDPVDAFLDDLQFAPSEDHFEFDVTRRRELSPIARNRGPITRLSIEARIGGRAFERFVVDLVRETATPTSGTVELGLHVQFAGLQAVEIAVIDPRTHWAEKLSAYLRRYDGRANTRVKDLVDLVLLLGHGLVEPGPDLHAAVTATFSGREQELPDELPSMAPAWEEPFAEMAAGLNLEVRDAATAHDLVAAAWRQTRLQAVPGSATHSNRDDDSNG